MWWRNYDDMLSRFDRIPERDGQTDGQTELLYQYRVSVCSRAIRSAYDWVTDSHIDFKFGQNFLCGKCVVAYMGKVLSAASNWLLAVQYNYFLSFTCLRLQPAPRTGTVFGRNKCGSVCGSVVLSVRLCVRHAKWRNHSFVFRDKFSNFNERFSVNEF